MKKLKDFFERLNKKPIFVSIKKIFHIFFVGLFLFVFIAMAFFCAVSVFTPIRDSFSSDNYETAYAYNADISDTNDYSQIYGVIIYSPDRKTALDNSRDYIYNLPIFPSGDTSLIYIDFPVLIVEEGANILSITAPQNTTYELVYSITLYNGVIYSGSQSAAGNCDIFGIIELEHNIPSAMYYRIDYLTVEFTTSTSETYYSFSIEYVNTSTFTYKDFVLQQREYIEHQDYLYDQTMGSIGNQISEFGGSLLNIEIFPNFRLMDLLTITLGIALAMAISKLWLRG